VIYPRIRYSSEVDNVITDICRGRPTNHNSASVNLVQCGRLAFIPVVARGVTNVAHHYVCEFQDSIHSLLNTAQRVRAEPLGGGRHRRADRLRSPVVVTAVAAAISPKLKSYPERCTPKVQFLRSSFCARSSLIQLPIV